MSDSVKQLEDALVELSEAWSRLSRRVTLDFKDSPSSVPPAQGNLLRLLNYMGPQRMSDIAGFLEISLGGCTAMVDRAIDAGLVERYRDEEDRRVVWVQLTEKGNQTLDEMRRIRARIFAKYLHQLEPDEIQQLATLLSRAAGAVQPAAVQAELIVEKL
jgi:MarR family transcriptional regulator, organic hydroperoxide resistance regulator